MLARTGDGVARNAIETGVRLTDEQRLDWLRLIRSDNVGPRTFRALLNHFGSARAALEALPDLARRGGAAAPARICPRADAERELEAAARARRHLGRASASPTIRRGCADRRSRRRCSPCAASPPRSPRPMVAIVGSRNASAAGIEIRRAACARDLGEAGFVDRLGAGARHRRRRASREPRRPAPSRCSPAATTASIRPSTSGLLDALLAERRRDLRNAARLGAARAAISRAATG